jgi:hypothetical protein
VEIPFIEFLTRIDMVYLTVGFSGFIVFIIIQYCAVVEYASKVFPKVKRLVIVIAVGVLLFILGSIASGIDDLRDRYAEYAVFLIPFASVIIPVFLLIAAKVKKNAQKMR